MLTLRRAPVYYLPNTKCGSTYLKNLFYYLDHSAEHASGIDIHSNADDLVRAQTGDEESIRQSPYAFAVLRDPVDRFCHSISIRFMVMGQIILRTFARIWQMKLRWI